MVSPPQKALCCGCTACQFSCPANCISMRDDHEGFLYPQVNSGSCTRCRRCEKVCPALHQAKNPQPPEVFACSSKDAGVRQQSSSGGLFSLLAEKILEQKGVVFGAAFNEQWEVIHRFIDSPQELALLRGSKYVQSRLGDTFKQVERFLGEDRPVFFTGTPCQVAGLKKFVALTGKFSKHSPNLHSPNLLTADIVCHGVPSPKVFRLYREEKERRHHSPLKELSFRDKTHGWQNYHIRMKFESETCLISPWKDDFMRGFLSDLSLRPSCYACFADNFRSGSDLTLADYWGISRFHPELFDDQGTSLVLVHTEKGQEYWQRVVPMLEWRESALKNAVRDNPCLVRSVSSHPKRRLFFEKLGTIPLSELIADLLKPDRSLRGQVKRVLRFVYRRFVRQHD